MVCVEKNDPRAFDDLVPDLRRSDGVGVAVKDPYVQLIFQFFYHQAQGGLGQAAGFGCLAEMPVIVYGNDISQLLECHIIDFIYAKIKIIVLVNEFCGNIFAPSK